MAIYDRQWFLDVRSVLDKASILKDTPPQDAGKAAPPETAVIDWPLLTEAQVNG